MTSYHQTFHPSGHQNNLKSTYLRRQLLQMIYRFLLVINLGKNHFLEGQNYFTLRDQKYFLAELVFALLLDLLQMVRYSFLFLLDFNTVFFLPIMCHDYVLYLYFF